MGHGEQVHLPGTLVPRLALSPAGDGSVNRGPATQPRAQDGGTPGWVPRGSPCLCHLAEVTRSVCKQIEG